MSARKTPARAPASARARARAAGADPSARRVLGHAVVGLGFMGRTHIRALEEARRAGVACRLVAVSDRDPARLTGRAEARGNLETAKTGARVFDPAEVRVTTDPAAIFADPAVDSVSICTHTETHVELALRALAAGKHVLVEKPVALDSRAVAKLAAAARKAKRLAMPAMCMRFWPAWAWLRARVEERTFGDVRSAVFQRLASPPAWAPDFYGDARRTGGALFDLHVHDVDFVHWLFGKPRSVQSTGSLDHVTTTFRFAGGPAHVVAEGGWDHAPGFPFRMRFVVVFERATAEFDLARVDPLFLHRNGRAEPVAVEPGDGYEGEMRHFLAAVLRGDGSVSPSMEEAAHVTRLLEAGRRGLERS